MAVDQVRVSARAFKCLLSDRLLINLGNDLDL